MRFLRLNRYWQHWVTRLSRAPRFRAGRMAIREQAPSTLIYNIFIVGVFSTGLMSCNSAYKGLHPARANADCILKFRPEFSSALYNTQVNVVGKHLSGLLLFKSMPDSSMRVVFTSEMGAKFFDFEFSRDGGFKVHQVMSQLEKKPVIKTLRNDFELILMRNLHLSEVAVKQDSLNTWYGFPNGSDIYYYVTNKNCDNLVKIEHAMKRKPKVQLVMNNYRNGVPDTIGISHRNFDLEIGLKFIER